MVQLLLSFSIPFKQKTFLSEYCLCYFCETDLQPGLPEFYAENWLLDNYPTVLHHKPLGAIISSTHLVCSEESRFPPFRSGMLGWQVSWHFWAGNWACHFCWVLSPHYSGPGFLIHFWPWFWAMYTVSFFNQARFTILAQAFYKVLPILVSSLKTIVEHPEIKDFCVCMVDYNEHLYKG